MNRDLLWPIGIISSFGIAILGFGSYIVFALGQRSDLVSPNYYADELAYQARIDSAARTTELAEPPALTHDDARRALQIQFPAGLLNSLERGQLKLYRPSNAEWDVSIPIQLDAGGLQWVDTGRLAPGLWKVQLSWSAAGQAYFMEHPLILP